MKQQLTIYIAEIGYGSDTRYVEKQAEKLAQHTHLLQLLREQGWKVADPCVFVFGVGGTIYKSFHETLHNVFQLPPTLIDKLAHQLQRHAITTANLMVSTRRHLEHTDPHSRLSQHHGSNTSTAVDHGLRPVGQAQEHNRPMTVQDQGARQPTATNTTAQLSSTAPASNLLRRRTVLPFGGARAPGTRKRTHRHTSGSLPNLGDGALRATKRGRDAGGGG
jgi:hypothetical protein